MINAEAQERLITAWRAAMQPPDRRPITEWLHEHWELPPSYAQPGRFDVSTSRHLIAPFEAFQSDTVREISCMAAIQNAKTLIVEGCIPWALCHSPGPIMWTFQTDDDAKEHCNQRFMDALLSIKQIRDMMPFNRHHKQTTAIYFGGFFLEVNGANLSSLQRVSIRYKFNSEVWLWKKGLLAHARGRVTKFEEAGNSKVFNESQGGTVGDDMSLAWDAGTQQVWGSLCFGCKKLQPLVFSAPFQGDSKKFAGVVWNSDARRPDGTWNVGRACETSRWVCPSCGHQHPDTPQTRAQWNADGAYTPPKDGHNPANVSFRWEGILSRPMAMLTEQFLQARAAQKSGVDQLMQDFTRQRRGLPWNNEQQDSVEIVLKPAGYNLADENITAPIDNEAKRFMTIDRQRDHFWTVVRAWRSDGSSRLLFRGRVTTPEQLRDIQEKFKVEDQLTFEDAGYFPTEVYKDCATWGWTALKGSGDNYFTLTKNNRKIRRLWSDVTRVLVSEVNKQIPLIHWASDPIKDILYNLRTGKGALWETADDAGEEYHNQLKGDHKKQTTNKKTGRPEWRWFRRHANHMHDCEAMQVDAALMLGILVASVPDDEKGEEKHEA